jgi:hypothetical protein
LAPDFINLLLRGELSSQPLNQSAAGATVPSRTDMKAPAATKYKNDVLTAEYVRVSSSIQGQESQSDKILSIGVTIISVTAAAGIAQKVYAIFFLVPMAVIAISLYALSTYFYIQSLAGYKRHLEDLLNDPVGEGLLIWERLVQQREATNTIRKALLASYAVISCGLVGASAYNVAKQFGCLAVIGLTLIVACFLPFLVKGAFDLLTVNEKTYRRAKALHGPLVKPSPAIVGTNLPLAL